MIDVSKNHIVVFEDNEIHAFITEIEILSCEANIEIRTKNFKESYSTISNLYHLLKLKVDY